MKKKVLSIIIIMAMVLTMSTVAAIAAEEQTASVSVITAVHASDLGLHHSTNGSGGKSVTKEVGYVKKDVQYFGQIAANQWVLLSKTGENKDGEPIFAVNSDYVCPICGSSTWVSFSNNSDMLGGKFNGKNIQVAHTDIKVVIEQNVEPEDEPEPEVEPEPEAEPKNYVKSALPDFERLCAAVADADVSKVVIHPAETDDDDWIDDSIYNLVISDPGMTDSIVFPREIQINEDREVSLEAAEDESITLLRSGRIIDDEYYRYGDHRHFEADSCDFTLGGSSGTLILEGPRELNYYGGGVYIYDGTLTMNDGVVIYNCRPRPHNDGGGVYCEYSTFVMNGGEISGNTASKGGGVYCEEGSTFVMNGGEISGNTGGGVNVCQSNVYGYGSVSTFEMNGGEITGNTTNSFGGGVEVYGTFEMNGGLISGNTANYGGGVYLSGTFVMNGGEISGNIARIGGCVYHYGGTFEMNGGLISGNTASVVCGGVYLYSRCTFVMNDGEISGNTAIESDGGGVWFARPSTFVMNGGLISGNTADIGGGVFFHQGTFVMNGGEISGNTANYGGGVYCYNRCTFEMYDGLISGNTALIGGGVLEEDGVFVMYGGEISSNIASIGGGLYFIDMYSNDCKIDGGVITGNSPDDINILRW